MKLEKNIPAQFFITLADEYWLLCLLCIAWYQLLLFPAGDYSVSNKKREHHFYYLGGSYVIVTILLKKIQWFIQNHGMGYPDQSEGGTEKASEFPWVFRWSKIYLWSYSKRNVLRTVSKNSRMTSLAILWVTWEQHIFCVSVYHESFLIINTYNFTAAFFTSDFFHLQ